MLERNDVYWQCGEKATLHDSFESVRVLRVIKGTVIPCRDCPQDVIMGPIGTVVVGASGMASLSAPAPAPAPAVMTLAV